MSILIRVPKTVVEFLHNGTMLQGDSSMRYYHDPFWYKETNLYGVFEVFTEDELPRSVNEFIKQLDDK